jgi:hypothetical protein
MANEMLSQGHEDEHTQFVYENLKRFSLIEQFYDGSKALLRNIDTDIKEARDSSTAYESISRAMEDLETIYEKSRNVLYKNTVILMAKFKEIKSRVVLLFYEIFSDFANVPHYDIAQSHRKMDILNRNIKLYVLFEGILFDDRFYELTFSHRIRNVKIIEGVLEERLRSRRIGKTSFQNIIEKITFLESIKSLERVINVIYGERRNTILQVKLANERIQNLVSNENYLEDVKAWVSEFNDDFMEEKGLIIRDGRIYINLNGRILEILKEYKILKNVVKTAIKNVEDVRSVYFILKESVHGFKFLVMNLRTFGRLFKDELMDIFKSLKGLVYLKWKYLINNSHVGILRKRVLNLEKRVYSFDSLMRKISKGGMYRIFNKKIEEDDITFSFDSSDYIKYFSSEYDGQLLRECINMRMIHTIGQYLDSVYTALKGNNYSLFVSKHRLECKDRLVVTPPLNLYFEGMKALFPDFNGL